MAGRNCSRSVLRKTLYAGPRLTASRNAHPARFAFVHSRPSSSAASNKIQVIPFAFSPNWVALAASTFAKITAYLGSTDKPSISRLAFQLLKGWMGLSSSLAKVNLLKSQPILLPYWYLDISCLVGARIDGVDNGVGVSATDVPCIGTNLAPFSSFNYLLPTGHDFAETLEPYDESQYKTFPKLYGGMQETPDIVTIPFSFFPDLPAALRNTLGAIRDVDIRLSGRVDNGLYAAYPIYVPFFLAEVEVIESNSPPWTTTVLIYAGKPFFPTGTPPTVPIGLYRGKGETWEKVTQAPSFSAQIVHIPPSIFPDEKHNDTAQSAQPFNSQSPADSAAAALTAGSIQGMLTQMGKHLAIWSRLGVILTSAMHKFTQDVPLQRSDKASPARSVYNKIFDNMAVMSYSVDNIIPNRNYIHKLAELKDATFTLDLVRSEDLKHRNMRNPAENQRFAHKITTLEQTVASKRQAALEARPKWM